MITIDGRSAGSAASPFDIVVLAASRGGIRVHMAILHALPAAFPAAVVVVQHRGDGAPDRLPAILGLRSPLEVTAARLGEPVLPGTVYVAAARQQLVVEHGRFAYMHSRQSRCLADPLLFSVAEAYGSRSIAVILSGGLHDGAAGAMAVKRAMGRVIVQDSATSEDFGMPRSALATGCVDFALPPAAIASSLISLTMVPGAAAFMRVPMPSWATSF